MDYNNMDSGAFDCKLSLYFKQDRTHKLLSWFIEYAVDALTQCCPNMKIVFKYDLVPVHERL